MRLTALSLPDVRSPTRKTVVEENIEPGPVVARLHGHEGLNQVFRDVRKELGVVLLAP